MTACDDCLRRTDLIAALAGRLQIEFKQRSAPGRVLALPDEDLLELAHGEARHRYAHFAPKPARERAANAGLWTVCRCAGDYPARLHDLTDPPAVIHGLGVLTRDEDAIAVVGARVYSLSSPQCGHQPRIGCNVPVL